MPVAKNKNTAEKKTKKKSIEKTSNKKTALKKQEEKTNMGKIQTTICRDIINSAEVTKSQVSSSIVENASNFDKKELQNILNIVNSVVDSQSSSLIDRVMKVLK